MAIPDTNETEADERAHAQVHDDTDVLTTAQVAEMAGLSPPTVRRKAAAGEIRNLGRAGQLGKSGGYRFRKGDVRAWLRRTGRGERTNSADGRDRSSAGPPNEPDLLTHLRWLLADVRHSRRERRSLILRVVHQVHESVQQEKELREAGVKLEALFRADPGRYAPHESEFEASFDYIRTDWHEGNG